MQTISIKLLFFIIPPWNKAICIYVCSEYLFIAHPIQILLNIFCYNNSITVFNYFLRRFYYINISALAISPSKTKVFSILKNGVTGIMSEVDGGSKVGMLDIPFKEWLVTWPTDDSIILTTKASAYAPGFVYNLNTRNKSLSRIFGGYYGFTTLPSNDALKFLFSQSSRGQFKLSVFSKKDNSIKNLPLITLPEKCVWAKTEKDVVYCAVPTNLSFNIYPDVWYQGLITFSVIGLEFPLITFSFGVTGSKCFGFTHFLFRHR
jgi:hypothetical protein